MKKYILNFVLFICCTAFSQETINQLDKEGKRHGLWKGIYEESKRPRYEGVFEHGIETGIFKYFDDTKEGKVIATRDFSKGNNSCYVTIFDRKNNIVSEGLLINRSYEGVWKFYHKESKIVMTHENYKQGQLNGIRKVFYNDGSLAESMYYLEGKKQGNYKRFGINEKMIEELNYKNDQLDGEALFYDGLGNLILKGQYKEGLKSGIWYTYENGKVIKEEKAKKINAKNFTYILNEKGEKIPSELKDRDEKDKTEKKYINTQEKTKEK